MIYYKITVNIIMSYSNTCIINQYKYYGKLSLPQNKLFYNQPQISLILYIIYRHTHIKVFNSNVALSPNNYISSVLAQQNLQVLSILALLNKRYQQNISHRSEQSTYDEPAHVNTSISDVSTFETRRLVPDNKLAKKDYNHNIYISDQ